MFVCAYAHVCVPVGQGVYVWGVVDWHCFTAQTRVYDAQQMFIGAFTRWSNELSQAEIPQLFKVSSCSLVSKYQYMWTKTTLICSGDI